MYSAAILEHFRKPRNVGTLPGADAVGQAGTPGQGPFLVIHLRLEGERIAEARFRTYGCPVAIACGSLITEWVRGKTAAEAGEMDAEALAARLGEVPLGKEHLPELAVAALRSALGQRAPAQGEGR